MGFWASVDRWFGQYQFNRYKRFIKRKYMERYGAPIPRSDEQLLEYYKNRVIPLYVMLDAAGTALTLNEVRHQQWMREHGDKLKA